MICFHGKNSKIAISALSYLGLSPINYTYQTHEILFFSSLSSYIFIINTCPESTTLFSSYLKYPGYSVSKCKTTGLDYIHRKNSKLILTRFLDLQIENSKVSSSCVDPLNSIVSYYQYLELCRFAPLSTKTKDEEIWSEHCLNIFNNI